MTDGSNLVSKVALQALSTLDQAKAPLETMLRSGEPELVGHGLASLARQLQRLSEAMANGMGLDAGELKEREAGAPLPRVLVRHCIDLKCHGGGKGFAQGPALDRT